MIIKFSQTFLSIQRFSTPHSRFCCHWRRIAKCKTSTCKARLHNCHVTIYFHKQTLLQVADVTYRISVNEPLSCQQSPFPWRKLPRWAWRKLIRYAMIIFTLDYQAITFNVRACRCSVQRAHPSQNTPYLRCHPGQRLTKWLLSSDWTIFDVKSIQMD